MKQTLAIVLVGALVVGPGVSWAGPEGENVVHGQADFVRDGDLTVITTQTRETVVQYSGFDIGVLETVRIDQPDAASRILNHVLSTDPTRVDGSLFSNGEVWIVNPVGVFFGDRAIVDVGGLVAAAGQVDPDAFVDGIEAFTDLGGSVSVESGAVIEAADRVLLVGRTVENHGAIRALDGMIALVAGGEARVARVDGRVVIQVDPAVVSDPTQAAVVQAGTVDAGRGAVHLTAGDAYSLAMNHTGVTRAADITVAGGDGEVRVGGVLDASSEAESGGRIAVTGDRVLLDGATLDASGDAGGGEILVGGEAHGEGDLATARRTYVSNGSTLRADATGTGDGGRIIVWADDATAFYGSLSARGGEAGGDGGFAEISGARSLVSRGRVDLGAPSGEAGTLLYDPARILITGGSADGSDANDAIDPATFLLGDGGAAGGIATADTGDGTTPFVIYESEIEGTDADIVLQASQSIETTGEFDADDVVIAPGRDLTLEVMDAGEDVGPGEIVGIDVATDGSGDLLTWRLSDGGVLRMSTQSFEGRDTDLPADLSVGAIEASGVRDGVANNVVLVVNGAGSIDVASIDTAGAARVGEGTAMVNGVTVNTVNGGNVSVLTQTGNVSVGTIDASGGDASAGEPGDGGTGGDVLLSTLSGQITVDGVDVSGGDGVARLVDDGAGGMTGDGRGGDAGAISLIADLDPTNPDLALPPGGDPRAVVVTGDLLASGGHGLGEASDGTTLFGADGGAGGQIFASAGHVAGEGSVTVGSAATPVRLDASAGDGTANGGAAGSSDASAFTGAVVGAVRLEAQDTLDAWAEIDASGGDAGWNAVLAAPEGPGGVGGSGGDVSFATVTGDATLHDTGSSPGVMLDGGSVRVAPGAALTGLGGDAGNLTAEVAGDGASVAVLGEVSARGGDGNDGNGGDGGAVTVTALDGDATLFGVDTTGGVGTGTIDADPDPEAMIEAQGALGGDGGAVTVTTQAGTSATSVGGGDVLLGGAITTLGGAGVADPDGDIEDPRENHGLPGAVRITSAEDVDAAPAADVPSIISDDIEIRGDDVFASGSDLRLTASGLAAPENRVDRVLVEADGAARVLLDDQGDADNRFERVEFIQTDASSGFDVLRGDASTTIVEATGAGDVHTIQEITTDDLDPHLTYRLTDTLQSGSGGSEQIDVTTLAVETGAVNLGANGGKLANARANPTAIEGERLTGAIQGTGGGAHVTTSGNLEVYATDIGTDTPLVVTGTGGGAPAVELGVSGDVALDVTGGVAIVDLNQRRTAGNVDLGFAGGDGVSIVGTIVDDGASRIEGSRITRVDTDDSGVSFFFELSDATRSSNDATLGEPILLVASNAMTLGADAGVQTTGDLQLEGDGGPAIDAGGFVIALAADVNGDGNGMLEASGSGSPDIIDAGGVVAIGGEGVGTEEAPLRTRASDATGEVVVTGLAGTGGFYVVNENGGATDSFVLREITLSVVNQGVSGEEIAVGNVIADGDVVLDNQGGPIVLGTITPEPPEEGEEATLPVHVASGGSLRLGGDVLLSNPIDGATVGAVDDVHQLQLQAGGEVVFEGDIDTHPDQLDPLDPVPGSLTVAAPTTILQGDVGSTLLSGGETLATVGSFVTNDLVLTDGSHAITVNTADFRSVDGPGALVARGLGEGSQLRFAGDVGVAAPLASLDVDADLLRFDGTGNVVAGAVLLNTATPSASVPDAATIVDAGGGLAITSDGVVTMGRNEKFSSIGPLQITAADTATLGDLSATDLVVDAPRIVILGRDPGAVGGPGGGSVADRGVDWVANGITTNVVPEWDGQGTAPVFALGSGGILIAGGDRLLPFDTVRFDPSVREIKASDFVDGARVLDLTGTGPRVVSDASNEVPREAPGVSPSLEARFDQTPPASQPPVTGEDLLATLRCRTGTGAPCLSAEPGDEPLATERTREIVETYHALVSSETGRRSLAAAFEPLGALGPGVEGTVLYGVLASRRALAPARERIDELAAALARVSLLGIDASGTARVRAAIARDFADAAALPGLDGDLVLATVEASGVGVLPVEQASLR